MIRAALAVPLALALALAACRGGAKEPNADARVLWLVPASGVDPGEVPAGVTAVAKVEVAADPASREHGLMHRDSLAADSGMLFVYPDEGDRAFWMKNTRIPLSIAYADAGGTIVRIRHMAPGAGLPESRLPLYPSDGPATYALEMEAGWFAARGIREGDRIRLHPFLAAVEAR